MQNLLDRMGIIDLKYKVINEQSGFNLIELLMNIEDEVNLHSRILYELFNPQGSHRLGDIPLNLFLARLGIDSFEIQGVNVEKERHNIDILLTNVDQKCIIIENKINAQDQLKQLERYHDTQLGKGYNHDSIIIIYLTLHGNRPTDYSLGSLREHPNLDIFLKNISYEIDISKWISDCIKEAAFNPSLRESLHQYLNIIKKLTTKDMEERKEINHLLSQGENAKNALKIVKNWIHFKWHTEDDFWNDLRKKIESTYSINSFRLYSPEYLNGTVHRIRNKNSAYGISFEICKYRKADLLLYIERGESNLYYGILILENGQILPTCKNPELKNLLGSLNTWPATEDWFGGRYSSSDINFESFSSDDTLSLANPLKRSELIGQLWSEIKAYVYLVNEKLMNFS